MPDNKVDQKITDRSAKEFSESIQSNELYKELRKKNSEDEDKDKKDLKKVND